MATGSSLILTVQTWELMNCSFTGKLPYTVKSTLKLLGAHLLRVVVVNLYEAIFLLPLIQCAMDGGMGGVDE